MSRALPTSEPLADGWDWRLRGHCRAADPSIFFTPEDERGRARAQREKLAKEICEQCPVISQCRAYALAVREPYGVRGGLSASDRESVLGGND